MENIKPKVVIAIPTRCQSLDVAGPMAVFRETYNQSNGEFSYDVKLMSMDDKRTVDMDGMTVKVDYSVIDMNFPIDTLLVAGTSDYHQAFNNHYFCNWLRHYAPKNTRRYGSLCTGAFFLGVAGLLDGKQVTTHWQQAKELAKNYPKAKVFHDSIYVQDGPLCSSAGVTAGIDLSLKLIEDDFGRKLALKIAQQLVVFLRRPGGQSQFSANLAAQFSEDSPIFSVQKWILENIEKKLSLPVLAKYIGMSVRNFNRVFHHDTGYTPANFVEIARIDAAKRLLEDTNIPLKCVASKCGFSSVDVMRRAFIRHLSIGANDYRKRFGKST